jgi:arylsulfatase A-like enzyme
MTEKPNIVFILIDDMGWKDLTCYGSDFYETPTIDRIREEGMLFTDAYAACPVCSPTRGSILSGKYPARLGITDWIDWGGSLHPARGRVIDVPYIHDMPLNEKTLAHTFSDAGYATWHVGKWHLGGPGHYPDDVGFDVNVGGCEHGSPGRGGYFAPWTMTTLRDADAPEGTYLTDYLTDKAVDLIENNSGSPFFLNMWYYTVHTPIQAKEEKIAKYRKKAAEMGRGGPEDIEEGNFFACEHKKQIRIQRRRIQSDPVYAAMIESLDENVERILDVLDRKGFADNTIVIFTSDNGGLATAEGSPTCNAPLSEGKGWMYEGGTREPLLIRWPKVVKPGSETDEPVTSPDFYPTLLEAAGIDLLPQQHDDGFSFLPLLKGERWSRPEPLFWHYPHYGNQGGTPGASVREGDWKLVRFFETGHEELYNLRRDIGEEKNLAETELGKRADLSKKLTNWQNEIEASIPQPNPEFQPWEEREPCGHSEE